ncbi:MAG: hypothetical protein OXU64_01490 [Gemmatimonadota bacterium]|nr:hypothetical protein [Gemmatimonadota bacterium]
MNTKSKDSTDQASRDGGRGASITPSTAALMRRLGPSPAPRMLTPSEIALLRADKREMPQVVDEALARKDEESES